MPNNGLANGRLSKTLRAIFALAIAAMVTLAPASTAWAADDSESWENAGNYFAANEQAPQVDGKTTVPLDYMWAGQSMTTNNLEVGGDMLAAGMSVTASDVNVGSSIRVAAQNVNITSATVKNNVTVAAQNIIIDGTLGGGAYAAGQTISFTGKAAGAAFSGGTVKLNGTITGDATITAENIEIGPDTVVEGTLNTNSPSEPKIPEGASVGDHKYTHSDFSSDDAITTAGISAAFTSIMMAMKVLGVIGTIVSAVILVWLFRRPVESATKMSSEHMGRIFATGAVTAILAPIAFLILLCFGVTSTIAFAFLFALITLTIISVPFAAASFAGLALPKMNRFGSAAIGGAALGICAVLPILGVFISIAAFMFIAGYIVQVIWNSIKHEPEAPGPLVADYVIPATQGAFTAAPATVASNPAPTGAPMVVSTPAPMAAETDVETESVTVLEAEADEPVVAIEDESGDNPDK